MVRKIIPAFKLEPALKEYIWGGDILKRRYGKRSKLLSVAESWEVSAHPDGQSIIASGEDVYKRQALYHRVFKRCKRC